MSSRSKKKIITIFSKYGVNGASTRYRFYQYFDFFNDRNINFNVTPLFDDNDLSELYKSNKRSFFRLFYLFIRRLRVLLLMRSNNTEFVIIYTELFPYTPPLFELLLVLKKIRYILDYDDASFHQYDRHRSKIIRFFLGKKISYIMRHAELVIVGNKYIEAYAFQAKSKRVEIIPTVVDLKYYTDIYIDKNEEFTIVWIGSPSTSNYLNDIIPALVRVCNNRKIKVRLIGAKNINIPGVLLESLPWSKEKEVELISECHVGIMPLADSPWEKGKCGLKIIQYMACGLPVVASPVGVNNEIIDDGINGYTASSIKEWTDKLIFLYDNQDLLYSLGRNGREKVKSQYSLQKYAPYYANILKSKFR